MAQPTTSNSELFPAEHKLAFNKLWKEQDIQLLHFDDYP
jgi:hypothetical protein